MGGPWPGGGAPWGQGDALLVHALGLRAHDEAEEVLVGHGGAAGRRRGGGAALVVQTGALGAGGRGRGQVVSGLQALGADTPCGNTELRCDPEVQP